MTPRDKAAIQARLRILKGQVASIERNLDLTMPCDQILERWSSVRAAVTQLAIALILAEMKCQPTAHPPAETREQLKLMINELLSRR